MGFYRELLISCVVVAKGCSGVLKLIKAVAGGPLTVRLLAQSIPASAGTTDGVKRPNGLC
jgi:hypothetical protein